MIRRLIMALVAVVILVVTAAPVAVAQDYAIQDPETAAGCYMSAGADGILPAITWGGGPVGRFHMRLGPGYPDEQAALVTRSVTTGQLLTIGDAGWTAAITATDLASRFCPGEQAARYLDSMIGKLWQSFTSTGLVAGMTVVALGAGLWQLARRRSPKAAVKALAAISLLTLMASSAAASTPTHSAPWSPSWVVNGANRALAEVSGIPAAGFLVASDAMSSGGEPDSQIDCRNFIDFRVNGYRYSRGEGVSVPLALDAMWRSGPMLTWTRSQFGESDLGLKVGCWLLEWNRGGNPLSGPYVMGLMYGAGNPAMDSVVVTPRSDQDRDVALVAMAACNWDGSQWSMDPAFVGVSREGREYTPEAVAEACAQVWAGEGPDSGLGGLFDIGADERTILQSTQPSSDARSFLLHLHGYGVSQQATALVGAMGGVYVGLLLGLLALTVIAARVALFVIGLFLVAALFAELIPGVEGKVRAVAKAWFEAALVAVGSGLILAVVATLTVMLYRASDAMSPGPVAQAMWGAACPILAVLMVALAIKSTGRPSPFSIKGAAHYLNATHLLGDRFDHRVDREVRRAKDYVNPRTHGGVGNPDYRRPVAQGELRAERLNGMEIEGVPGGSVPEPVHGRAG